MPANNDMTQFDYIIVGAGSAGSVLADRLSADGRLKILVLEAGGKDSNPFLHIPAGYVKTLVDPKVLWQFRSAPSVGTGGREIALPQGRAYGGSSSLNGLVYNRGQTADFNTWAQLGNTGWAYEASFLISGDRSGGSAAMIAIAGATAESWCPTRIGPTQSAKLSSPVLRARAYRGASITMAPTKQASAIFSA
jgi:hypothetical protein